MAEAQTTNDLISRKLRASGKYSLHTFFFKKKVEIVSSALDKNASI
jgi:hypothetical protein